MVIQVLLSGFKQIWLTVSSAKTCHTTAKELLFSLFKNRLVIELSIAKKLRLQQVKGPHGCGIDNIFRIKVSSLTIPKTRPQFLSQNLCGAV